MTVVSERRVAAARPSTRVPVLIASSCAALAGGIHLAVVPEHLTESWLMTVFFLVVGLAQLGLAVALRWQLAAPVLAAAVVAHLSVIALYVTSRTVDLPFVPPHGPGHDIEHLPVEGGIGNGVPIYPGSRIEPVGVLDVACLIAELILVALLTGMLPPRWRRLMTSSMLALGMLAIIARASGLLG